MKRVKIMFSAILVLAVLAGALAFKAKKLDGFCLYTTTLDPQQVKICLLVQAVSYTTTPVIFGGITVRQVFTTRVLDECPLITPTSKCTLTLTIKAE